MSTMLRDFFIIFSYLCLSAFRPVPLVHAAGDTGQSTQTQDTSGKQYALSNTISSLQQELRTKSEQYEKRARAMETATAATLSSFVNRRRASNSQVGFTARFSNDPVTNVGPSGTYVFDNVVTNVGNGYNSGTGIFTAPVTGLYVLFLKFMSTNEDHGRTLVIVKNGAILGYVWGDGSNDVDDQSSTLVATFMEKGQQAWVRHYYGPTAVRGVEWTEFTGFLVQAQ